ncbi:MAG TPA: CocE/NonD family hydrolase [Vicinamibacterales bacterium]|jgi:predicted acyl esterase|nr:CocE/NonD family hydrolase [Vicinamibacterales bacterium]
MRPTVRTLMLAAALGVTAIASLPAQRRAPFTDEDRAKRFAIEQELASIAIIERKVMIPTRDGVRIQADIYRPKDESKKYPAIWVRTPYNMNWWDIANEAPRDTTAAITAVKNGYATCSCRSADSSGPKAYGTCSAGR